MADQFTFTDPTTQYRTDGFPEQSQDAPGLTTELQPGADHGEQSYRGMDKLKIVQDNQRMKKELDAAALCESLMKGNVFSTSLDELPSSKASSFYVGVLEPSASISGGQYLVQPGRKHTTTCQKILNLFLKRETKCVSFPVEPRLLTPVRISAACVR